MSELQSLSPELLIHVAQSLQVPMKGLVATMELLDEGSTVPFIARYRKEARVASIPSCACWKSACVICASLKSVARKSSPMSRNGASLAMG